MTTEYFFAILNEREKTCARLYCGERLVCEATGEPCNVNIQQQICVATIKDLWLKVSHSVNEGVSRESIGSVVQGIDEKTTVAFGFGSYYRIGNELAEVLTREFDFFGRHLFCTSSYASLVGAGRGAPCGIVLVGLGVEAQRLYPDGTCIQRDGWGFQGGDRGSGAWIGRVALRAYLQYLDGCGSDAPLLFEKLSREIGICREAIEQWLASATVERLYLLARMVFDSASNDDPMGVEIVMRAVRHLIELAQSLKLDRQEHLFIAGDLAGLLYEPMTKVYSQSISIPAGDVFDGLHLLSKGEVTPEKRRF